MTRERPPAAVLLRMSPQLRAGLREAADAAGCSVNAFAVQVLATAVGDPARFRVVDPPPPDLRELERDALGYPLGWAERSAHMGARSVFIGTMEAEVGSDEMVALVRRYDAEDPAFFVEWLQRRQAGPGFEAT